MDPKDKALLQTLLAVQNSDRALEKASATLAEISEEETLVSNLTVALTDLQLAGVQIPGIDIDATLTASGRKESIVRKASKAARLSHDKASSNLEVAALVRNALQQSQNGSQASTSTGTGSQASRHPIQTQASSQPQSQTGAQASGPSVQTSAPSQPVPTGSNLPVKQGWLEKAKAGWKAGGK